jgi:hypothetical protein
MCKNKGSVSKAQKNNDKRKKQQSCRQQYDVQNAIIDD